MTYGDNPIRRYREAHPENVVWTPETGWIDQQETETETEEGNR